MDDFTKEPGQDETPKEPSLGRFSVTPSNGKQVPAPSRPEQPASASKSAASPAPTSRRSAKRTKNSNPANVSSSSTKRNSENAKKPEKNGSSPGPLNWIMGVVAGILTVALVGGAFAFGYMGTGEAPEPEVPVETTPPPREGPVNASPPLDLKTCSVTPELSEAELGKVYLYVIDNDTEKVVRDYEGDFAIYGGNITRVATGISGLLALGKDFQIGTKIFLGTEPGTLVVKGYGDVTLSKLSSGSTVYPSRAHLAALVQQAVAAYLVDEVRAETPITAIYFDTSYFKGDDWHSKWNSSLRSDGYLSRITALQLDGDRSTPNSTKSKRSNDPVAAFISAFKGIYEVMVPEEFVTTPPVYTAQNMTDTQIGEEIAQTYSAKYSALLPIIVTNKDLTLTEALGRIIAAQTGGSGSFTDLSAFVPSQLNSLGVNLSRFSMSDASGTSVDNRVGANFLAELSKVIYTNKDLVSIHNIMPTSGQSGDLSKRFNTEGMKDKVRAFAGTGTNATSLSGYVIAEDGTQLHFGVISTKTGDKAVAAVDAIVAKLYKCGANLSNR